MMPVRPLRPALIAPAWLTLCGVLAAGPGTAHPAQAAAPFWHHFLHHLPPTQPAMAPSPAPRPAPDAPSHSAAAPPAAAAPSPRPSVQPLPVPPSLTLTNEDRQAQLTLFTALNFMLPRLLTIQSPQQLCLWGMTALLGAPPLADSPPSAAHPGRPAHQPPAPLPQLSLTIQPDSPATPSTPTGRDSTHPPARLVLLADSQPLLADPMPPSSDITGWSQLSTRIIATLHDHVPRFQIMSDEALLARFLNGMLARLDPYSRYLPPTPPPSPSDQIDAHEPAEAAEASIGLSLRHSHSRFPIIGAINLASPLWDAGIIPGDSLISLNSHSTRNTSLAQLQDRLNGPAGSTVRLGFRMQDGHYLTQDFTRSAMMEETVFPEHAGPHVVLRVTHFSSHTAEEISQYLSALLPPPPTGADSLPPARNSASNTALHGAAPAGGGHPSSGLVLDLRGNRGGMLQQAIMTAALFLDHGVIATTEGRAHEANHVWSIQGGDLTDNTPLALLVDRDTGSAAEVLAAALADQKRAVVTGSSSFGKGMVQVSAIMPNGGRLTLTWAHITAPQGWALQGLGVIPQLCTAPHGRFPLRAQLAALREGHSLMAPTLQQAHLVHEDTSSGTRLALRAVCPPAPANPADISAALALFTLPHAYQAALLPPAAPASLPQSSSPPLPSTPPASPLQGSSQPFLTNHPVPGDQHRPASPN